MADELRILGVCGSPRKGGAEILIEEALASARDCGDIATDLVLLRREKIGYCTGCFRCSDPKEAGDGCPAHSDSMVRITDLLLKCHGLILATPVYFGGPTAQLKTFIDRTEPLLRYSTGPLKCAMRNKVGAAIAVGQNRGGGQEATIQAIHHFFFIHDMTVVGAGPDERPGCYLGGSAWSGIIETEEDARDAVRADETGLRAARIIGRRVAEATRLVFAGETKRAGLRT